MKVLNTDPKLIQFKKLPSDSLTGLIGDLYMFGGSLSKIEAKQENTIKKLDKLTTVIDEAEKAIRYNSGKVRMDLIPPEADRILAEVLTFGADKYAARNWEKGGLPWVEGFVASMKRHLNKWEMGEEIDEESGMNHMYHVFWNAMALSVYIERGIGEDDRNV